MGQILPGSGMTTEEAWLSAPTHPAAASGHHAEPQEALLALSRGKADDQEAWWAKASTGNADADGDPARIELALVAELVSDAQLPAASSER